MEQEIKGKSLWKQAFNRLKRDKLAMFGASIIILLILVAIFAPILAPYNPDKQFINGTTAYGMPLPINSYSKKVEIVRDNTYKGDISISNDIILSTVDKKNNFKFNLNLHISPADKEPYIPVSAMSKEMINTPEGTILYPDVPIEGVKHFILKNDLYFLFGTDANGRDILSRLIYGSRVSLQVGIVAVGIACIIGIILGLISGYFGGWIDITIMRITDIMMSFPDLLLVMAIVAIIGPSLWIIFFAIGLVMWTGIARIVRSQVLAIREVEYIEAARAIGGSHINILFKHILPNVMAPVIVIATMYIAGAIMTEAALSFLGFGVKVPTASWGSMINDGLSYFRDAPSLPILPGVFIAITVFAFNLFGDGLRDALDPKLKV